MSSRAFLPALVLLLSSACRTLDYPERWDAGPFPGQTRPSSGSSSSPAGPPPYHSDGTLSAEDREELLQFARSLIGSRGAFRVGDDSYPFDCSGFVSAVYAHVGIALMVAGDGVEPGASGTEIIFAHVADVGKVFQRRPRPGDLVFFDNTWDRNGDGRLNDDFTHIALVSRQLDNNTLELIHLGNSGVGYLRMNLSQADTAKDEAGEVLNDPLRRRASRDGSDVPYLSAQLFRGFGRLP
jgi:hypothetical protein